MLVALTGAIGSLAFGAPQAVSHISVAPSRIIAAGLLDTTVRSITVIAGAAVCACPALLASGKRAYAVRRRGRARTDTRLGVVAVCAPAACINQAVTIIVTAKCELATAPLAAAANLLVSC